MNLCLIDRSGLIDRTGDQHTVQGTQYRVHCTQYTSHLSFLFSEFLCCLHSFSNSSVLISPPNFTLAVLTRLLLISSADIRLRDGILVILVAGTTGSIAGNTGWIASTWILKIKKLFVFFIIIIIVTMKTTNSVLAKTKFTDYYNKRLRAQTVCCRTGHRIPVQLQLNSKIHKIHKIHKKFKI